MPRVLHTSDLHLGTTLESLPREADQRLLLDWLANTLVERSVDVLVVAGDVFDQAQPSADAQRLYYDFLHRVAGRAVRHVVVVGGNHDSAARLDAPRDLLAHHAVHVVGGLSNDPAHLDRAVIPLSNAAGEPYLTVLAVPFVHEYRLGIRTTLLQPADLLRSMRDAFATLYASLADRALARAPGIPILATGHLACIGSTPDDAPADIHMIGSIGGLPDDIFDPRIAYVALGHVHRAYRVGASNARYCGTPLALSLREAKTPRSVVCVDIGADGTTQLDTIPVPAFRPLLELAGSLDDVLARIASLSWDSPLAPYLYVNVLDAPSIAAAEDSVRRAVDVHAPRGVRVLGTRLSRTQPSDQPLAATAPANLRDLTPEQVFLRLCASRDFPVTVDLLAAFHTLLSDVASHA